MNEQSWIIVNPNSGGGKALKQKAVIVDIATKLGWKGKYYETSSNKNSMDLVTKAIKSGIKHIVVGGGDGTIRQILKSAVEANLTLGILPLGTGNVLATNLAIPIDLKEAIKIALLGDVKDVDLGEVNGSYFAVITGMGIDVETMSNTKKSTKSKWGILAYVWNGVGALSLRRKRYRVIIDGDKEYTFKAKSVVVANMAKTVGGIDLAPGAGPQSNDLKVVVINATSIKSWINLLFNTLRRRIHHSPYYKLFNAQKVEIFPLRGPRNYQVDGDELPPTSKMEISFHPKALKVRVPTENNINL